MYGPPKSRRCHVRRRPRHLFPLVSRAHLFLYLSFSINKVTQSTAAARAPHRIVTSFTRPTRNGESRRPIVLLRSLTQTITGEPPLKARHAPRLRHRPLATDVKEGGRSQVITRAAPPNPASDEEEHHLVGAVIVSAALSCFYEVPVEMITHPAAPALPISPVTVRLFLADHLKSRSL